MKRYSPSKIIGLKRALLALFFSVFALPSLGAELISVAWEEGGPEPAVQVILDGEAEYNVNVLEDGLRLRVTFADTVLAPNVRDIGARGKAKGVFPYLGDDGESVHVDILMKEPGELRVEETDYGYRVIPTTTVAETGPRRGDRPTRAPPTATTPPPAPGPPPAADFNTLEGVSFTRLAGDRVRIKLKMTRQPEEPGSFSISKPARIALDFFNTRSGIGNKTIPIGEGVVESISAIQADDRTRIVLNLLKPAEYETRLQPDGMTLVVEGPGTAFATAGAPKTTRFAKAERGQKHGLTRIDFRRGAKGAGSLIVTLSDTSVGIDISEQAGEIIVNFADTKVPAALERRLDVLDFATPVQTIDTFQQGRNTRVVIRAMGKYEYMAYQAGNVFTVDVKPVIKKEKERKVDKFGYSGEKLSLSFQNIEVRAALQVIADFTDLNFVTSDAVKGSVTLRLKDVPWDQALDIILRTKGLAMRKNGDVIWVAPAGEIAAKEKQQLEASKSVAELEPLVSELIQINYAKAADIATLLKSIKAVGPGVETQPFSSISIANVETESNSLLSPRGNVTVDARTNTILIQDTPSKIREVKKLIAQLDRPVRQVMIETRIVEANDDFSKSLGARFGATNRNTTFSVPGASSTNAGDAIMTGNLENAQTIRDKGTYSNTGGLNVNLPSPGVLTDPAAALAFTLFKIDSTHLLSLELSALEAEGRGKIIASPRLVTANQKQARIEQGQERFFPPSGFSTTMTLVKATLSLTVTPQVTPEDSIILDVDITQDTFVSPTDRTKNTKQISTQVLLQNGETVVIGGIYQQQRSQSVSKVPLFGDLPLIGALFRKKSAVNNKTELLIFLTPRIINPALNLAGG